MSMLVALLECGILAGEKEDDYTDVRLWKENKRFIQEQHANIIPQS